MTQHVLSLSYGKDSIAALYAIERLGWPLDRIIHADIWATGDIPADPPPMVEFKAKADAVIQARFGIEVEHLCAVRDGKTLTYEALFYRPYRHKTEKRFVDDRLNVRYGFPTRAKLWCNSMLKADVLDRAKRGGVTSYLGIAADEPERIRRHSGPGARLPLVELGWDEAACRRICEDNGLLSPIYTTAARGGCWFCHNQGVDQLRRLRRNYPERWGLLLRWDADSPVSFKADGHTVHDFDRRFRMEDEGLLIPGDSRFRWTMLDDELNYRLF